MDTKNNRKTADRPFTTRAEREMERELMAKYQAIGLVDIKDAAGSRQQQAEAPAVRQSD